MRRKVLIVGVGAGNPDFVTVQAIDVRGHVTLFFIPNQRPGLGMKDHARLRAEILELYVRNRPFRTAPYKEPCRSDDSVDPAAASGLRHARLWIEQLDASECAAFLVWSAFSLLETVQRILQRLRSMGGFDLDYEVIPGNSGIQVLTTAHKVALCNIGRSILTATGRSIAGPFPNNADTIAFMLGAVPALDAVNGQGDTHWSLYAGMPDDMLVSGWLREIVGALEQVRNDALDGRGWTVEAIVRKKGAYGAS